MEVEKIRERLLTDPDLRERVAWRAFEIFASRGYQGGSELDDWLQAEDEVLQQVLAEIEQPTVIVSVAALMGTGSVDSATTDEAEKPKKAAKTAAKKSEKSASASAATGDGANEGEAAKETKKRAAAPKKGAAKKAKETSAQ